MTTAASTAPRRWLGRVSTVILLTLIGRFLGFLFPVALLRELDQESAGLAFFLINTAYFVVQPVSGGPATVLIRRIAAADDAAERSQWARATAAAIIPATAVSAAIGLVIAGTSPAPTAPMLLLVAALAADISYFHLLLGRRRYVAAATYRLASNVTQLVVLVAVLIVGTPSLFGAIAIFASSYVVGFAAVEMRTHVLREVLRPAVSATRAQRHSIVRAAIPTALAGIAYSTLTGFDTYLVGRNAPDLLPTYGAAKSLAVPLLLVSYAVTTMVQPEVAQSSAAAAWRLRRRLLSVGLGIGAIATLAATLAAEPVLTVLYGDRYPDASTAFRWLAAGTAILGVYTLLQSWCYGRGSYVKPLVSLTVGGAVAISANLLLVPSHGAAGAGMGMLAGSTVALLLLTLATGRHGSVVLDQLQEKQHVLPRASVLAAVVASATAVGLAAGAGFGELAVGAVLVCFASFALASSNRVCIVALFGLVPALSGLDRGLGVPGLRPAEILTLAVVGLVVARAVIERRFAVKAVDVGVFAVAAGATVWSFASGLVSDVPMTADALGNVISPMILWLLYVGARYAVHGADSRRLAFVAILASAIPVAALGVLQQVGIPGTRSLATTFAGETDSLADYHTFYRATAVFAQGHILSAFLFAVAVVALIIRVTPDQRRLHKIATVSLVSCIVGMAAAATATPAVALVAVAAWIAVQRRIPLRLVAGIAIVVLTLWLSFGDLLDARVAAQQVGPSNASILGIQIPQTIGFRIDVWRDQYQPLIANNLLFGVGPVLPVTGPWEFTESQYVTYLLRGGVPLLLMMLLGAAAALRWTARQSASATGARAVGLTSAKVLIAATIVMCTVNNYVGNPGLAQLTWLMLGIAGASSISSTRKTLQGPT